MGRHRLQIIGEPPGDHRRGANVALLCCQLLQMLSLVDADGRNLLTIHCRQVGLQFRYCQLPCPAALLTGEALPAGGFAAAVPQRITLCDPTGHQVRRHLDRLGF